MRSAGWRADRRVVKSWCRRCFHVLIATLWLGSFSSDLVGHSQTAWGQQVPGGEATGFSEATAKALAAFNRGAALMEQYRYSDAANVFESVLELAPDWGAARFNLGLAYFNMHGQKHAQDKLHVAREVFEEVLRRDPDNLHAAFCLGMYHQHVGESDKALQYFQKVYRADPEDPYSAYKVAETLIAAGRNDEGMKMLEHVVSIDPGFISAVYRLALQYRRTQRMDKAMPLFQRFQQLKSTELAGGGLTVQNIYGAAGKYSRVLGADNLPLPQPTASLPRRIVFSPGVRNLPVSTHTQSWTDESVGLPGVAAGDVDNDGDLDLVVTAFGDRGDAMLWRNDGQGSFSEPVTLSDRSVCSALGDIDNDGDLDLYLGRAGSDWLLENDGTGQFARSSFRDDAGSHLLTRQSHLIDLDSDGDLDVLALRRVQGSPTPESRVTAGGNSVFNNNRDGTFDDISDQLGLDRFSVPTAFVVCDDFDNDRDTDMILFPSGPGTPIVWVNDRLGAYRLLEASKSGLSVHHVLGATTGDPDKDGDRDLLLCCEQSVELFRNDRRLRFSVDRAFENQHGSLRGSSGQWADMDNDGDLDLVIADASRRDGTRGPALLINDWPRPRWLDATDVDPGNLLGALATPDGATCTVADLTGDGRCDLLLAPVGSKPQLIENCTPGGHWIELDLRGTIGRDRKTRSNNSAVGARVEIKTGAVYQEFVVGTSSGPVATGPLRIHAGLGDHAKVDWLRILWPDAVLQAEIELPADRVTTVTELSRKTSSCPYLFAWNGSHFEFVGDFGGVGGLGYLVTPGTYAPPDPTEVLRVPSLRPLGAEYVLNVVTPFEEVTYFDEARLIAVDHPEGTQVYPYEMMAISVPPPPPEIFCFRDVIDPIRATDHRGVDVTDAVLRVDRRYAGATQPDDRFIGLAEDHFVELDFGDRLNALGPEARLILVLNGWVEYGYSTTNYAAAQAGLRAEAPSVSVFRHGRWHEVLSEVGYPAGVQHVATIDVTGSIKPQDRRIRIDSNMEVYWDRIFLAEHLGSATMSLKEAPAARTDLHYFGYPREYSPDGRHPNLCDYDNLDRSTAWKLMSGNYTRYGPVTELVRQADDCYVIMGRGEEMTLRFPVEAFGPVPKGKQRTFLLKTDSFCKDMDLYTAYPDTVEPLPFHGMSGYPYGPDEHYPTDDKHRQYRRTYNTRRVRSP